MFVNRCWRIALRFACLLQRIYWFLFRQLVEGVYTVVWHGGRLLIIQNSYKCYRTIPCGFRCRGSRLRMARRGNWPKRSASRCAAKIFI